MGRILIKCAYCSRFFATGMNIPAGQDPRKKHSFKNIPYRCTECGEEREYSSNELVDEGARVGGKGRRSEEG